MVESSSFFAVLSRMKYIQRWGLMHNTRTENLSEHTLEVAMLTHLLLTLRQKRTGEELDAGQGVLYALYHDCSEILTGDLPTPVKYYNPDIQAAYRQVEAVADEKLVSLLPQELQEEYAQYFCPGEEAALYMTYVKAADRLSALIKCMEEQRQGNREFLKAEESTREALRAMSLPEVDIFLSQFLPAYRLTLDELSL